MSWDRCFVDLLLTPCVYYNLVKTNIPFLLRLLNYPDFINTGVAWTTFIDDTPELLQGLEQSNRGQKLLRYLGDLVVNGTKVKGQMVRGENENGRRKIC